MKKYLTLAIILIAAVVSTKAEIVGGTTLGYLTDSQDAIYTARLGYKFKNTTSASHIAEIEIGYTRETESGGTLEIMPIMLNYRAEIPINDQWGSYLGFGVGQARVRVQVAWFDDSDMANAGQLFGGFTRKLNDNTKLTLGARYINIREVTFLGTNFEVGDDLAVELGVAVKF